MGGMTGACEGPLDEVPQKNFGWADPNSLRAQVVFGAGSTDLPGFRHGISRLEIADTLVYRRVRPFGFHQEARLPRLHDDKVDLAQVHVAKVAELHIKPLRVLQVMDPFQEVQRDQILESPGHVGHERPVVVVVLLGFLDGANARSAKREEPDNGVHALECGDPTRDRVVAHRQIFADGVDRQRRSDELGEPKDQKLEVPEIRYALEGGDIFPDQTRAVFPRPAA